jgi:type II secretory pathway component PulF
MPLFDYVGQLENGASFQGTLEAPTQLNAAAMLADMGVLVTALRPAQRFGYVTPLSLADFLFLNEHIGALAKSGMPLEPGLRQLAADCGSRRLKSVLLELADDVSRGTPLEQAIERRKGRFPSEYANVVAAGVRTGDLGGTLYGLAAHLRLKSQTRQALVELSLYPLLILLAGLVLVAFLMRVIVPAIADIVADIQGFRGVVVDRSGNVPATQSYVWFIFGAAERWPLIEAAIVAGLVALLLLYTYAWLPIGRRLREFFLRRIPGVSQVYVSSVMARFTHTSALAAYSGTPLPELVAAAGAASGSLRLRAAAERVAERLRTGASVTDAAAGERDLPAMWLTVASVAGSRGDLPAALEELARLYEQRAQNWLRLVRIALGPILLILVGGGIALVLSAVALALTSTLQWVVNV